MSCCQNANSVYIRFFGNTNRQNSNAPQIGCPALGSDLASYWWIYKGNGSKTVRLHWNRRRMYRGYTSDRTVTWISSNPSISPWWQLLRRTAVNYATQFCCKLCNAVLKRRVVEEQIRTEICRLGPPRDILSIFFETYANLMCSNFFVLPQTRFSKIGSSPNLEKMSWPWVDSPFQLGARADFQKSSFG